MDLEMISWRCRGCGDTQDCDAPRDGGPECGSCGKALIPFDPPPRAKKRKTATRAGEKSALRAPPTGTRSDTANFERVVQSSLRDIATRLAKVESDTQTDILLLRAVAAAMPGMSDYELGVIAKGLERRASELWADAKLLRNEQDRRQTERANARLS